MNNYFKTSPQRTNQSSMDTGTKMIPAAMPKAKAAPLVQKSRCASCGKK